jgi:hypothetical protein
MGVTTWLDRITDESNVWLSALKAEEGNDFAGAAVLYIGDAANCLKNGSVVRSALSCACAAECLAKAGANSEAKTLYLQAALMYSETAEAKVSTSIREALWALQRAYECFVQAGDTKGTQATYQAFTLLARRANPFDAGAKGFELPKVGMNAAVGQAETRPAAREVQDALARFMKIRGKTKPGLARDSPPSRPRRPEGIDAEASVVSQLG